MSQSEYLSSSKVMFSDRSSIIIGILTILLMIVLPMAWVSYKFLRKPRVQKIITSPHSSSQHEISATQSY